MRYILIGLLCLASPAHADCARFSGPDAQETVEFLRQATKREEVFRALTSIAALESAYTQSARGASGEIGVFQLLPNTAAYAADVCGLQGRDPAQLRDNVLLAVCYFRYLVAKAEGDVPAAVAAFNAGPSVVAKVTGLRNINATTANYLAKWYRLRDTACIN